MIDRRELAFGVIAICWKCCILAAADQSLKYAKLPESRKEGTWQSITGMQTALKCCSYCQKQSTCFFVNYNTDDKLCEVVTEEVMKEDNVTHDPLWTGYYILHHIADVSNVKSFSTASMSSLEDFTPPGQAIDGNTFWYFGYGTCIHTGSAPEEWWMVDFGKLYRITGIIVWNRADCCSERFNGIQVLISEDLVDSPTLCAPYPGPPSMNPINITCAMPIEGRYLKIVKHDTINGAIHFCEVDFY